MTTVEELLQRSISCYEAMNDSEKLRMWYEQRRSFARGMCSDCTDYDEYCHRIDNLMPHESTLTDAQIGLVLMRKYHD